MQSWLCDAHNSASAVTIAFPGSLDPKKFFDRIHGIYPPNGRAQKCRVWKQANAQLRTFAVLWRWAFRRPSGNCVHLPQLSSQFAVFEHCVWWEQQPMDGALWREDPEALL